MNSNILVRKVIYILAMVGLLLPLYFLGLPPVESGVNGASTGGGKLAQLRRRYDIGQASLGQLDPASETMRMASLGLRGVAATILWQKSDYYKTEKYWDRLSATLNQLALLQPHFVSVWESQAHNLSYNVSAEFDDYHERYEWVKKGMDYLVRGTQFNRRQPLLQWLLGKSMTQKLGRSDEKTQFRELFRNDNLYHSILSGYGIDMEQSDVRGADRKPDNWLVGRQWFLKAHDLVRAGAYCKKNPLYFFADSPMAYLYCAESMEEEGVLDDKAAFAWSRAGNSWREFGNFDIMTTWGHSVQLRGLDAATAAAEAAEQKFTAFTEEVQNRVIEDGKAKLTDEEYAAVKMPAADRNEEQKETAKRGLGRVLPGTLAIAQMMPREKRAEAILLANDFEDKRTFAVHVLKYREQANYDYWEKRAESEQTPVALAARRQLYQADKLLSQGDLETPAKLYEAAWRNWDKLFKRYPMMMTTEEGSEDVVKALARYAKDYDIAIEEDFPLDWFLEFRSYYDRNRNGEQTGVLLRKYLKDASKYEGALEDVVEPDELDAIKEQEKAERLANPKPKREPEPAPTPVKPREPEPEMKFVPANQANAAEKMEKSDKPADKEMTKEESETPKADAAKPKGANRPPKLEVVD